MKKNRHYLEIISRHTNRLINIVKDLLLLSEFEEEEDRLKLENVNLKNLTENIVKIFEQRLQEKNLNLIIEAENDFPIIKADVFKLIAFV